MGNYYSIFQQKKKSKEQHQYNTVFNSKSYKMKFSLIKVLILVLALSSVNAQRRCRGRRCGRRARFNPLGFGGLGFPAFGFGGILPYPVGLGAGLVSPLAGGLGAGLVNPLLNGGINPLVNRVNSIVGGVNSNANRVVNTAPQAPPNGVVNNMLGKRSETTLLNKTESVCEITKFEETSLLECSGPTKFECELESNLTVEHLEKHLVDLRLTPSNNTFVNETVYSLLSMQPVERLFNNWTLTLVDEPVLWTLYNLPEFEGEGFRVKEIECWRKFDKLMSDDRQVELSVRLSF